MPEPAAASPSSLRDRQLFLYGLTVKELRDLASTLPDPPLLARKQGLVEWLAATDIALPMESELTPSELRKRKARTAVAVQLEREVPCNEARSPRLQQDSGGRRLALRDC